MDEIVNQDAERLGRIVREVWVGWAQEQPDVAEHPSWLVPYEDLPVRDRNVDKRIGLALYMLGWCEARERYTGVIST